MTTQAMIAFLSIFCGLNILTTLWCVSLLFADLDEIREKLEEK